MAAAALAVVTVSCSSEPDSGSAPSTVTVTTSSTSEVAATTTTDAAAVDTATETVTTAASETQVQTPAPLPAANFADGSRYSFATPSKLIQCRVTDGTFICQTQGHPHTVTTASLCGFYPNLEQSRAVRFGWFPDGPQPCATVIQGEGFDSPNTLGYGDSAVFSLPNGRTVTCASAENGLTCTQVGSPGATGFFLSIDSFTVR
ncbi:hypothetical protein ACNHUS_18725 [Actinomycetes bacterium M1A6_2h]